MALAQDSLIFAGRVVGFETFGERTHVGEDLGLAMPTVTLLGTAQDGGAPNPVVSGRAAPTSALTMSAIR